MADLSDECGPSQFARSIRSVLWHQVDAWGAAAPWAARPHARTSACADQTAGPHDQRGPSALPGATPAGGQHGRVNAGQNDGLFRGAGKGRGDEAGASDQNSLCADRPLHFRILWMDRLTGPKAGLVIV